MHRLLDSENKVHMVGHSHVEELQSLCLGLNLKEASIEYCREIRTNNYQQNTHFLQLGHPNRRLILHLHEPVAIEVQVESLGIEARAFRIFHNKGFLRWDCTNSASQRNESE